MTEILNGSVLAQAIKDKVAERVANLRQPPGLGVILVGDNPASHLYVSLKERAGKEVGVYVEKHLFEQNVSEETLLETIANLNKRQDIQGIILQLPLPEHLNVDTLILAIHPTKDVDGFHPENRRALLADTPMLVPPVALAIMRLIQATHQPLKGKQAVILGNSEIFAEPLKELLRENDVQAEFVASTDAEAQEKTRLADIVIVATGNAHMLTRGFVKESAIVIDVGTNKTPEGKVIGDASPTLLDWAGFLSKVPGGVGPLTVAYLFMNLIKAKELQEQAMQEHTPTR